MGFLSNLFRRRDNQLQHAQRIPVTRTPRQENKAVDWTDGLQANTELTKGLFHNTAAGFKLAGALAYAPIVVPVQFMGLPILLPEDDKDEDTALELEELIETFAKEIRDIHTECHRDGTIWIYPNWDARDNKLRWEFIGDETVTDVVRNMHGDIVEVHTAETLTLSTGFDKRAICIRKRRFTKAQIDVSYTVESGIVPPELRDVAMRNPLGILPIPFANNADARDIRGYSDYERILSDLKDYHDISYARSLILAKFKIKMVQTVHDVNKWEANNGYSSTGATNIDIANTSLIFNTADESTAFVFPNGATEPYGAALKQIWKKITQGAMLPEIVWGLKTPGNSASVEESMTTLIKYVQNKQVQKNVAYVQLFTASLMLLRAVGMRKKDVPAITITWGGLDAVSEQIKANIFSSFATGMSTLAQAGALTHEQMYNMWRELYPNITPDKGLDDFIAGTVKMSEQRSQNSGGKTE